MCWEEKMFKKLVLATLVLFLGITGVWAATYYSRSSGQWNTTTRWNTARDGSGSSHDAAWTGNHIYYIQNGHAITRPGIGLGSTSSSLVIEDGGSYTHGTTGGNLTFSLVRIESNATFTANATGHAYTTFTIYGGGKYIHNTGSSAIPGVTRNFANSTNGNNGNGTVEIQNQGSSAITSGITWGNVIINNTTTTQAIGNAAAFANVEGDFKVLNTNGNEYRFMAAQTTTHNIGGDLIIEGGALVLKSADSVATVNIGKGVRIDGGSLTLNVHTATSSGIVLNVKEDFVVDSGSFLSATGTNVSNTINLEGALKVDNAANFRAYNASTSGAGYLTINFTNTQSLNRSSELKLRTGYDRYFCKWDINVKSGRTITLGSDIEIGTTNNSSYQNNTFTVENGGTLNTGTYIIKNGSGTYNSGYEPRFTLSSGATLITANANGITSSGANGSVQVTGTRTYNTGANYTYNGTSAQVTGNGLPATVNNLRIDNTHAVGVSLGGNLIVSNDLAGNGTIQLGNHSLTINGSVTGAPTIIYNGSGTATIGTGAPSVITLAAGATSIPTTLTTLNVSGSASLPNATTVGSLNIAGGSSLNVNNHNLKFNAANNVTFTQGTLTSLSASESTATLYPVKINRQWTINGALSEGTLTATFTWTADDDNSFNWTGKTPALYLGETKIASGTEGSRSITTSELNLSSKGEYTIGVDGGTLPIELSSFTAMISAHGFVQLMWITQSETNVRGFYVYRAPNQELALAELVSPLINATNTSTTQSYVYLDREIYSIGDYYYWLQNVDMDGSESFHGPVLLSYNIGGNGDIPTPPLSTMLSSIYPNPFNPDANISYSLASPAEVKINIYNQRGQLIRTFDIGTKAIGRYSLKWNGFDCLGNTCSSGLYIFELIAGKQSYYKKATLTK